MSGIVRSGGCHTCRRRRVKCDQREPFCERCEKARFHCEGYARDLKFVDEKDKAEKRVQLKRDAYLQAIQLGDGERAARNCKPAKANTGKRREPSMPIDRGRPANKPPTSRDLSMSSLGRVLPLTGQEDRIQMTFTLTKLFAGARLYIPWILTNYRGEEDCTTTQTVKALSSMYFGRMHHHPQSMAAGIAYYSKTLVLLQKDLEDPDEAYNISSIVNVLSLCLFEMMASESGTGMIQHSGGVQKILRGFEPERFQGQPNLTIFESCRLTVVNYYIERRMKCFLEEEKWRSVPWVKHPEAKGLVSLLYDEMAYIGGILEEMDTLGRNKFASSAADVSALRQVIRTRLDELYNWRALWERTHPDCCSIADATGPGVPWPTILQMNSLHRLVEIALYNTTLILLFRAGRMLMGPGFSATPAPSIQISRTNRHLLLPGDPKTPKDIATEVLRFCEYAFLDQHASAGCFQMLFPLRIVMEVFKHDDPEWAYAGRAFQTSANKGGYQVSKSLWAGDIPGLCGRLLMDEHLNTMDRRLHV